MLQHVAACCIGLQCVTVCCSVLSVFLFVCSNLTWCLKTRQIDEPKVYERNAFARRALQKVCVAECVVVRVCCSQSVLQCQCVLQRNAFARRALQKVCYCYA